MKATLLAKENGEARFTIEFSAEELEGAKVKVYQAKKDQFVIDGFRKGKAPRSIIEKKYGEEIFLDDAINDLLGTGYPDALKELDIDVIDQPRVEFGKLEKDAPFIATITVAVYPEIEVKDYKGVEIERIDDEVTAEDVEKELANMQKRNARMVSVDRAVEDGDHIIFYYKGFVGE